MYTLNNKQMKRLYKLTQQEFENFIQSFSHTNINGTFLDVGTGNGRYAKAAYDLGFRPVYGIDIDSDRITHCCSDSALEGPLFLVADILKSPKFNITFDIIAMMTDTINFILDIKKSLKVCYDLLKEGGSIYLSLSHPNKVRSLYSVIYPEEILQRLELEGLVISKLRNLLREIGFTTIANWNHADNKMFIMIASKPIGGIGHADNCGFSKCVNNPRKRSRKG